LDIGCGSNRILNAGLSVVGLDILLNKLRYARKFNRPLINGSIWALPFKDAIFDCVVCSEVIEHIPEGMKPFLEMRRVLKPGGTLVLGTPDYALIAPGESSKQFIALQHLVDMRTNTSHTTLWKV
jgi:ubiquinone/menaquinone biosynthesis C-methylase UbiE